jgi:hypothetical protein
MKFTVSLVKTESYTADIVVEAQDLQSAENVAAKECWELEKKGKGTWLYQERIVKCYHIEEVTT